MRFEVDDIIRLVRNPHTNASIGSLCRVINVQVYKNTVTVVWLNQNINQGNGGYDADKFEHYNNI